MSACRQTGVSDEGEEEKQRQDATATGQDRPQSTVGLQLSTVLKLQLHSMFFYLPLLLTSVQPNLLTVDPELTCSNLTAYISNIYVFSIFKYLERVSPNLNFESHSWVKKSATIQYKPRFILRHCNSLITEIIIR